jgi:polyisoprenoid-binding protein YceI
MAITAPAAVIPPVPPEGTYALDPPHTFIHFSAKHKVVGIVDGRFDRATGTIAVSPDLDSCTVDVSIDAQSLSTQNSTRDEDLRGPDFFAASKYPAIEYHGRGVRKSGNGWVVEGKLKIRDVTRTVPLSFEYNGVAPAKAATPKRIAFHGTAAVKRGDFGMTRELLDEIGATSDSADVWIRIDAELLATARTSP